jgi:Fur family ferric uptake transcriptional regulator
MQRQLFALIRIEQKGLRLTPQRKLIMDAICSAEANRTFDEIIAHVQARMSKVRKLVIYHLLEFRERARYVFKSGLGDHFVYHLAEKRTPLPSGMQWIRRACRLQRRYFAPVGRLIVGDYGFSGDFKHVVMSGLCKECQEMPQ